ncbi:hypothetical protein [Gloeothece verrucosa]|uniref:Uncharacterized protein n=1 Tax=Gloeothece verrucosa (strain PCC 7822) TaxID=497965 RepID=E0UDF9_GLOV7|nr:hypothetical protein [Gloeothece verrucosa]ADN14150.1 hypothetical protein Cyan7822_2171 [Gloeothece verrucosa PCC 7822]
MLKTIPKNWLTWNCDVEENNSFVGKLEFSWRDTTGKILTQKSDYRVRYKGLLAVKFFFDNYENRLGYAEMANPLIRVVKLNYAETQYQLKAASMFSKKFILQQKKQTLGIIDSKNILDRQAIIDLPTTLPLEFRLFVTWIVLWFWRRSERNIT